jgi:hypothetical protein
MVVAGMSDRRIHAYADDWQIVRYDRAGKWYAEWVGEGKPPAWLPVPTRRFPVNTRGRCALITPEAAFAAIRMDATIVLDLPGGRSFDAHIKRYEDLT